MTAILRPARERGHADHGWLDTWHSFSFADYVDPRHMGFRTLRVINDDIIAPGAGFPPHPHRDMEILTYVIRGTLAHKDSTGGEGRLHPGDIQVMSAGTGIRHSEYNASATEDIRLLQIWILPPRTGLPPAYAQTTIPEEAKRNRLALLAAPTAFSPALPIHQDARIHAARLDKGNGLSHHLEKGRGAWVQMVAGTLDVNGVALADGDGLALEDETMLRITATENAEFLLFDLG